MTTAASPEQATFVIAIGLALSLICYLVSNLSPGGMITPAWLALTIATDPRQTALIATAAVTTYGVCLALRRVVILYGKRLFASVVLAGVFVVMTLSMLLRLRYPFLITDQTLGLIIPGLLAYQCMRQPIRATLAATGSVTALTYVALLAGTALHVLPT